MTAVRTKEGLIFDRERSQTKPNLTFLLPCPVLLPSHHNNPDGLSDTYNNCLEFDKSAPPGSAALAYARTMGYLIIYSPPAPRSSRPYIHALGTMRSSPDSDRQLYQLSRLSQ